MPAAGPGRCDDRLVAEMVRTIRIDGAFADRMPPTSGTPGQFHDRKKWIMAT